MKKVIFFICFIIPAIVYSQYYVSPNGNDSNSGSDQKPFLTIQKAASLMKAGDVCYIREGVYREKVKCQNSGSLEQKIVFTSFKNDKVILTGNDFIEDWSLYSENIYFSVIEEPVYQLCINGHLASEAQFPDINTEDIFDKSEWVGFDSDKGGGVKFFDTSFQENYWNTAKIISICFHRWIALNGIVYYGNKDSLKCSPRSNKWSQLGYRKYIGSCIGYIRDHINALSKENEWLWKNDTLFIYSLSDISEKKIEAQTRLIMFDGSGRSNIVLKNLNFEYGSVDFGASVNCQIEDCSFKNVCPFFDFNEGFDRILKYPGDTFQFGVSHWKGKGVKISGSKNIIRDCKISGSWGDGISLGGSGNLVENCLIENCNRMGTDAAGIAVIGRDHQIIHNTIRNCGRSGIVHNEARNIKILFNEIYNCGLLTHDNGLTYCFKTNGQNTEIAYNWLHHNKAVHYGEGIFIDNYCSGFLIHHNVIWNCYTGIRTNKPSENVYIYNNTVIDCALAQATTAKAPISDLKNIVVFNNLSDKAWTTGTDISNNISVFDFRSNSISDYVFIPAEGTSSIDAGVVRSPYKLKFYGEAPDAGAYEWGEEIWIPGVKSLVE